MKLNLLFLKFRQFRRLEANFSKQAMSLGIPIKLLHEASGFDVTIELKSGDIFRGKLRVVEDNMNCWLNDAVHTSPNGQKVKIDSTYLRGASILYVTVPEMFNNAKVLQTGEMTQAPKKRHRKVKRTFTTVKIRKQAQ